MSRTRHRLVVLPLAALLVALPVMAQDASKDLVIEDPAGDVRTGGIFVPVPVDGTPFDHIDIRSLRIGGETASTFEVAFTLGGWSEISSATETAAVGGMRCALSWAYSRDADYNFAIVTSQSLRDPSASGPTLSSYMYYSYWGDNYQFASTREGQSVRFDAATSTMTLTVEKAFVPVIPDGHVPANGDLLHVSHASCSTDTALFVYHYDFLDELGETYAFQAAGAGKDVLVSFGDASGGGTVDPENFVFPDNAAASTIGVAPGERSVIPVRLENKLDEKRLVLLSATAPAGWNATIAPSIFVKGNEVRQVNLLVTPPAAAKVGDAAKIQLQAQVAGSDSPAAVEGSLLIMPRLGEKNPTIYFHVERYELPPPYEVFENVFPYYMMKLSLLPEESGYSNEPFGPNALSSVYMSSGLPPLGHPVLFEQEDASMQFTVMGDAGTQLEVEMNLYEEERGVLFALDGTYGAGTHTIPLPPLYDGRLTLEPGARLYANWFVEQETPGMSMQIDPKKTSLTLPVKSVAAGINVTDGRFLPNLALAEGEDRVTYVNPEKEYAFDLMLSNDGVAEDDLQVRLTTENATGWSVRLLPGDRFRVPPGESTPLTVAVIPPADAAEGDTATIKLKAVSKKDPAASASLTLRAIATIGTEVDEKPYTAKEDQIQPLDSTREETPMPGLPLLLVLLGTLIGLAARRRNL